MDGEGSQRLLQPGEIRLARSVFGNSIEYHKIWVHHDSYFPFGLQPQSAGMAPDGELYFREWYRNDFSRESHPFQHIFIHELSHIWQRNRGMNVRVNGLISGLVSYRYHLNGQPLRRYSMEQQAQIIADYFILKTYGYASWVALRARGDVTLDGDLRESRMLPEYQKTLQGFPWC
ncbi:hypothetical protein SAMN05216563_101287 [Phytobacter palmae]|uniref:Type IV secretion protein Rhs n=1 Tax=Phytobacter palmae TaxID=1855371 RepID=A0ABU9V7Y7_9ENTR|nr:type IV secretion protein Rhs [Escherichia coli]SFD80489.1 hypothetical protein SAMN05216563_101287 [Phytobacter palmae]